MSSEELLMQIIQENWKILETFSLKDIYKFENYFSNLYPKNKNIDAKLRQILQILRNKGYIGFINNRGIYIRLK